MQDRRLEADAFPEAKTCIELIGAKVSEENAIAILTDEKNLGMCASDVQKIYLRAGIGLRLGQYPRKCIWQQLMKALGPRVFVVQRSLEGVIATSERKSTCSSAHHANAQHWGNCSRVSRG